MNSYKDVKICTYAICKNESKFVKDWVNNIWNNGAGSDYICVLDTGSTDETFELLDGVSIELNIPENHMLIAKEEIIPWRFDVARNLSIELIKEIPEHIDVCFCVDLDEKVDPDFWDDLRKIVYANPNYHRIYYKYAWSLDRETGSPSVVYWYDKIHHLENWKWEYPVHEILAEITPTKNDVPSIYLNSEKIYVKHYPDDNKGRNYLPLLKLRVTENPADLYGRYYLAREYSFTKNARDGLVYALDLYRIVTQPNPEYPTADIQADIHFIPTVCMLIGDFYFQLQLFDDSEYFYKRATTFGSTNRKAYLKLAQFYAYRGKPDECYKVLGLADINSVNIIDWRSEQFYWRDWKKYQIIADAKCWEGKQVEATQFINKALSDIISEQDKRDAMSVGFYDDAQFILQKPAE